MSLLNRIKEDSIQARKDRNTLRGTLLTTLYSESANIGKNDGSGVTLDAEVVSVVKKFIKGIDETLSILQPQSDDQLVRSEKIAILLSEKQILEEYLPSQLSDNELRSIIHSKVSKYDTKTPAILGAVMKELKESYSGQYDGAVASKLIKEVLSQ